MKRSLLVFILIFLISTPTLAATYTGYELQEGWREYQKSYNNNGTPDLTKALIVGQYVGYINGLIDCLNGKVFTLPNNSNLGQCFAVVGKYIDDHPSEWNLSAFDLVTKALMKAFPQK